MTSFTGLYLTLLSPLLLIVIVGGDFFIRDNLGFRWWHILVTVFCFAMSIFGLLSFSKSAADAERQARDDQ